MDITLAMGKLEEELHQIEALLNEPNAAADSNRFRDLSRRYAELQPGVELHHQYLATQQAIAEAETMLAEATDQEMYEFINTELEESRLRAEDLTKQLLLTLVPVDPMAAKNAIIEIRAGTGGDEAALFARDLFDMYARLAERRRWKMEVLEQSEAEKDGFKEVIFKLTGRNVYGTLELESGVHRVQRVPETEAQGRIHTSAATVAVLPELEELDLVIDPGDLTIDNYRAGGPGGQHMQKNDTAVRVTHRPSGIVVACSSERSQLQNKERAMDILRARLYEQRRQEQEAEQAAQRRSQIKSGDRSEKIRTYNYPQDRLTDHRLGMNFHNLPALMTGEIDELLEALGQYHEKVRLAQAVEDAG
ncbi:MAG TPA: peptide chain release factor 1 [Armatimonadota bacterium]|jgi:peptide chain release factor 1